jgi:hypothetical protein
VYELFYAVLSFFSEINPKEAQFQEYEAHSENKAFDTALYQIITNFYKA